MTLLKWSPEYQVGDAQIDSDHRYLFELGNSFYDAFIQRRDRKAIFKLLSRLVAYCEDHFKREEEMLADRHCPDLESHRESHVRIFNELFALQRRLEAGSLAAEKETIEFLRSWLVDHVAGEDKYADRRAREIGVSAAAGGAKRPLWYEVLQVPPDSPIEEIRLAYRKRMSEYHPDRVARLGIEIREVAERKSKAINAAYDEASREHPRPSGK